MVVDDEAAPCDENAPLLLTAAPPALIQVTPMPGRTLVVVVHRCYYTGRLNTQRTAAVTAPRHHNSGGNPLWTCDRVGHFQAGMACCALCTEQFATAIIPRQQSREQKGERREAAERGEAIGKKREERRTTRAEHRAQSRAEHSSCCISAASFRHAVIVARDADRGHSGLALPKAMVLLIS